MIPAIVFATLLFIYVCGLGLTWVFSDGEVFTRAAFAELALVASRAMHRAPREPLRARVGERVRHAFRDRTLPLDDLETPLEHETSGPPCPLCLGTRTTKPCCCTVQCGHPFCEAGVQS